MDAVLAGAGGGVVAAINPGGGAGAGTQVLASQEPTRLPTYYARLSKYCFRKHVPPRWAATRCLSNREAELTSACTCAVRVHGEPKFHSTTMDKSARPASAH